MKILVPRERHPDERRVAATPETIKRLVEQGTEVLVESGCGEAAGFEDQAFESAGARIVDDGPWSEIDILLKVGPLVTEEAADLKAGALVVGLLEPERHHDVVRTLAERGVTSLALELLPRVTRTQPMDALSSQTSISGYKAAILAASRLGKYFPLMMTAAGTVPPAKVVIIGAGVAGLQALATSKRLGAVVEVSDVRPAVKEQVESLGGRYIDVPETDTAVGEGGYAKEVGQDFLARQRQVLTRHIAAADVVITTAQVPGKPAPRIITEDMVNGMRPGSVIVDLAAARGGNCELTRCGDEVLHRGILIVGPANVAATMAHDASTLYARNVLALIQLVIEDGKLSIDVADEVVGGTLLTHGGEVTSERMRSRLAEAVS